MVITEDTVDEADSLYAASGSPTETSEIIA